MPIVLPAEANTALGEADETRVGNRYTMGVAAEISEHSIWPAKRRLGVDHPCDRKSSGEENEHDVLKPLTAIQRV
jgi:hypothetical protein